MLRLLFLLFLTVALSFAGSSDSETLQRASKLLKSDSKTDTFRAYNDYKNLYLRAVMNNDDRLRYKSLDGIVKSGKKLHIDIKKYEQEYTRLEKKQPAVKKKKVSQKKPSKQKKVMITSRHQLKSVRWQEGRLLLEFDKALKSNQLNYFRLYDKKSKRYRYIFDIHASMQDKRHNLRHKEIRRIKLAQFDPKTLRLVIENNKKLNISFKVDKDRLTINLGVKTVVAPKAIKPVPKQIRGKTIVIDPGHGGKDGGASGSNRKYPEKRVVLNIASDLSKILRKAGYRVYLTRTKDTFIKLQTRTKYANRKKADLFISIHANAVPKRNAKKAQGIETYFLSNNVDAGSERAKRVAKMENSKDLKDVNFYGQKDFINILNREKIHKSERLAHDLQRNTLAKLRKHYKVVKDAGVREGPFWILVGAQMPAVLVEVGFITHPTEGKRLASRNYQRRFAKGMADGIDQYFLKNP